MTEMKKGVTQDKVINSQSGWLALLVSILLLAIGAYIGWTAFGSSPYGIAIDWLRFGFGILVAIVGMVLWGGIYVLDPNQSAVLQFFGNYVGTDSSTGLRFVNPFYSISKISRRLHSLEVKPIKVNDATGNPIEIGAVVQCYIEDCAKATFDVDHVWGFVAAQADSALRRLASDHAYDEEERKEAEQKDVDLDPNKPTLLNGGAAIVKALEDELRDRVARGGVQIEEARISHLAYAPEIASAMLRRQQASAVIAARKKIVQGAVEMTHDAVEALNAKNYEMSAEQKSALVSNMLVVLVGDKDPVPVISTGK